MHFERAGDDGAFTPKGLHAAFLRGYALLGHLTQKKIDLAIPIWLRPMDRLRGKDTPVVIEPGCMTAVFVSVKRQLSPGTVSKYEISVKDLRVFDGQAESLKDNPYLALVMELGVQGRARYWALPTGAPRPVGDQLSKAPESFGGDVDEETAEQEAKTSMDEKPKVNPRYNVFTYGCSNTVYKVIDLHERGLYKFLLANDDIFSNVARFTQRNREVAMRYRPFVWSAGPCFAWYSSLRFRQPKPKTSEEAIPTQKQKRYLPDALYAGRADAVSKRVKIDTEIPASKAEVDEDDFQTYEGAENTF
ncbi:hypothetical protein OBBRIDRAFT_794166 [Obba rivulosa]|uniref:Uncharacterized protein n=1 Tax=Obba rivulosa TaxID=1052685 RepID=A0A8E2DJP1_9APHY|nr:hypothetical protein OBBRIDRAFT_794166 [Obba rivulosa]